MNAYGLKNISDRISCPRCQGKGTTHTSLEQHSTKTTCKACLPCKLCIETGFISINLIICNICHSKGFLHPKFSLSTHSVGDLRCIDCIQCVNCKGTGTLNDIPLKIKYSANAIHPHLLAAIIPTMSLNGVTQHQLDVIDQALLLLDPPPAKKVDLGSDCQVCLTRGFVHINAKEHSSTEDMRCFFCVDCRECNGKGKKL